MGYGIGLETSLAIYDWEGSSWDFTNQVLPRSGFVHFDWSPDSTKVMYSGEDGKIHIYNRITKEDNPLPYFGRAAFYSNKEIVIGKWGGNHAVSLINLDTQEEKSLDFNLSGDAIRVVSDGDTCLATYFTRYFSQKVIAFNVAKKTHRTLGDFNTASGFDLIRKIGEDNDAMPPKQAIGEEWYHESSNGRQ